MRALLQRVATARVTVDNEVVGSIGRGFLVLLGVGHGDDENAARKLAKKIAKLRVFVDDAGKMNLALGDVAGSVLAVSQLTLYADCSQGNRPSFTNAGKPEEANRLYDFFCLELASYGIVVERGVFGAHMDVDLTNDGPVTIWLDSAEL